MFRSYFFYLIYGAILTVSLGESEIVNRSTSQVELNVEWEHDYLMLKKIAKSQCDLTLGHCDTSCCGDVDCDEWQKQNFECGDFEKKCNGILSEYDCECGAAIKPEWFSFLCVVYTNPVYLGKFYTTSSTIVSAIDFKSLLKKKGGYLFKYMPENFGSTRKTVPTNQYKFGSQIMTYSLLDESMKLPLVSPLLRRMSLTGNSDACMMGTEKFRISVTAACLTNVVPGKCDEQPLSASFYLVQDNTNTINSTRKSMPVILKTLDFLEGAAVEVVKGCQAMEKKLMKFGRKQLYIFYPGAMKSCPKKETNSDGVICSDVVVNFQMSYMVNGSDINKVVVNFTVGNIGFLDSQQGALQKNVPVFVKQTFQTKFSDIFSNHSGDDTFSNTETTDSLLNRGYSVGEDLNFKYKR
ncbi:hypothetical protein RUM44_008357 [Polyplax serrata]|uniref:Uncharacterized protein n=1 Tax=Polyplax serrata TaxID=468196 RepID=A0ABR1BA46_POLSC